MKCQLDESITYFKDYHYVKMESEILPGEPVKCCHDKECPDRPVKFYLCREVKRIIIIIEASFDLIRKISELLIPHSSFV